MADRQISDVEEGTDTTYTQRIPVFGGAVTVYGSNIGAGGVRTLGETVRPDADGTFVLQRILPTGAHTIDVDVAGGPSLSRDIDVPASDLFYVGIVDVTLGKILEDDLQAATGGTYDDTIKRGRVSFYLKGKVKGDVLITASADTGEEDLGNLFRNLDEKNPRGLIDRIDPDEYYPVYGDDSTSVNDAPTAGKFYVRLEKDDSHVLWGTFKSEINDTEYLRNERTLYGAQGVYRSPRQTTFGEPVVEAQVYGAQPDTLPQRDVFLGTGGSSYFLKFQDISRGSETILIQIQDPNTGRIISRKTLQYGIDYDINYVQGLILLKQPLSGSASGAGVVVTNPNGANNAYLVVNYEHTPTVSDLDSFSYGGRVQVWVNDKLRVGASVQNEDLGTTEQKADGLDILYRYSDRTFMELEYARTDGVGTAQDTSLDGGLTLDTTIGAIGKGRAYRFEGQADLREVGLNVDGLIGGYFEDRSAGFSTLNYRSITSERLWGLYGELEVSERSTLAFEYDDFEDGVGKTLREGTVELAYRSTEQLTWEFGLERLDKTTPGDPTETGKRTDAGVRLTYERSDQLTVWGFAQATLDRSGGLSRNNRIGVGAKLKFSETWTVSGEVSDGSTGVGGRLLAAYNPDESRELYFGYELDPDREFGGATLVGRDKGSFVIGGRRKVNDRLTYFGENTYDLFGEHRALTSTYGADYDVNERLTFTGAFEFGRVRDPIANTDFDRQAMSFGAKYSSEYLDWKGRIEVRRDEGLTSGSNRDADTYAGSFDLKYKFDESQRLLLSVEGVKSENATASIPNAEFFELTAGYAYRPIDNDRLNVLAKYTYLYDMTERVGAPISAGSNFLTSPRQQAHILSLDASYDLNRSLTLGGKIGGRWSQQDTGAGFVSNNAVLGVVNMRYHVVHKWDALLELRQLTAQDAGTQTGVVGAVYRHVGDNFKVGLGYNQGRFSDDLSDVTYNDKGVFLNLVGKF